MSAKKVTEKFGQGRVMNAEEALAAGAVDRIQTFESLMAKCIGGKHGGQRASVEVMRLRVAQERRRARPEWKLAPVPVGG